MMRPFWVRPSRKAKDNHQKRKGERGNILFMVLIAIVLIGTLTAVVSSTGDNNSSGIDQENWLFTLAKSSVMLPSSSAVSITLYKTVLAKKLFVFPFRPIPPRRFCMKNWPPIPIRVIKCSTPLAALPIIAPHRKVFKPRLAARGNFTVTHGCPKLGLTALT